MLQALLCYPYAVSFWGGGGDIIYAFMLPREFTALTLFIEIKGAILALQCLINSARNTWTLYIQLLNLVLVS